MKNYSSKKGFTLAEVLIVLGIVGIVSALTIPTLVTNYQKKQTVVQLKKVYADLNNAVRFSEVDNGPMSTWEFPQVGSYSFEIIEPFIRKYYLPYFKSAKLMQQSELSDYVILPAASNPSRNSGIITNFMLLNNGVIFSFFANVPANYIWCLADINGVQKPNKVGRDIFVFDVYKNIENKKKGNPFRVKFCGYSAEDEYTLINGSSRYACNKENTDSYKNFLCGKLIEVSGWTIPENYPW